MKNNKNILYAIIAIGVILVIGGVTYAAYTFSNIGSENKINTGTINFNYVEDDTGLQIVNPEKISDEDAMISDNYFEFTISSSATGKVDVGYYIYLTTDSSNNTTLDNQVKYYLTSVNDSVETAINGPIYIANSTPFDVNTLNYSENSSNRLMHSGYYSFNNDDTIKQTTYRFRMWLDENYMANEYQVTEGQGSHIISSSKTTYKVKINVLGVDGQPVEIIN